MLRTRTVIWSRRLAMRRGPPALCAPARRLDVRQGCGLRAKRRRWAWHSLILKRRLSERPFEHAWQSCAYLQAGAQANSKFSGLRAPDLNPPATFVFFTGERRAPCAAHEAVAAVCG
jgi:hypothetical protein